MNNVDSTLPPSLPSLPAFQRRPARVDLAALVELLTKVPLDAHPTLYRVVSVAIDLDEILHGSGEVFEIDYGASIACRS